MLKNILGACFVVGFAMVSPAKADELADKVIVHTLKCEAGRVGQVLAKNRLPLNSRVLVDWKEIETTTAGGGLGASIPGFPLGGTVDLSKAREISLTSRAIPFNLHPANLAACDGYKIDIIAEGMGLFDCFTQRKAASLEEALNMEEGLTGCETTVTVVKKGGLNLRVKFFGADVGPNGSYESRHVLNTAMAAPSYKKK